MISFIMYCFGAVGGENEQRRSAEMRFSNNNSRSNSSNDLHLPDSNNNIRSNDDPDDGASTVSNLTTGEYNDERVTSSNGS